jgi:4-amino-4-deoxy-L-arabinose transferase-like glycosyltransferase
VSATERAGTQPATPPVAEGKPESTPESDGRYVYWVGGVAFLAALFMLFVVFRAQGVVDSQSDPYDYGKIAHGFVAHGFDKLTRRAASLYPSFLSVVFRVGGDDTTVALIQCALHATTCVLVYRLGRHLFNVRTGLVAGLACALHPMLLRYVPDLHMESWLTFWGVVMVWCVVRFEERRTVANAVLLGVVSVVAILSKGVFLPVIGVFGLVWLVRAVRVIRREGLGTARAQLGPLVALGLTMGVLIAPWTYRNYAVSGHVVMLTPGTPDAFIRGYIFTRLEFATLQKSPYVYAENESNALFRQIAADAGTTWEADEVVDDVNNKAYMKRMIAEHPLGTVRKCLVGLFTFWYEMTSLKSSLPPAILALVAWVLAAFGIRRARREGRPYWLVLLPVVVTNVFVAALIPLGRYSVPILPFLWILAAYGVDALLERRKAAAST